MQFERIKKSHKKEIILGALAVCVIGGALTFATTRAKYKLTEDIELAKGTVNYTPYDFKIMAMYKSEDGTNYTEINEMPTSGYTINEEKSYCTVDNETQVKGKVKTINGKHIITNLNKRDKCYIWFDKEVPKAGDTILGNITVNDGTPNFANAATMDEGIFRTEDGMYGGKSVYWRGKVTNNYVKFANKCWRIVRINGDGSIRLIYDGSTCHANGSNSESIAKTSTVYNSSSNNSSYVGWTYTVGAQRPTPTTGGIASNAKTQLESWFNSTITGTDLEKVADGKYCNDRNVKSGQTWVGTGTSFQYATYQRLVDNKTPTLNCPSEDIYILKVGLITADEVSYAGGRNGSNNTSYYLFNGQHYWTMSPSYWYSDSSSAIMFDVYSGGAIGGSGAVVFAVNTSGNLTSTYVSSTAIGLRPVINLKPNTMFVSGGDGTENNPYVVE